MKLKIVVAKRLQRPVRPDAGRPGGTLEDAGDLGERELLEPRQKKDLPVIPVEAAKRPVKEGVVVPADGGLVGAARLVRVLLEVGRVDRDRGGRGPAKMVGGAAPREMVHPRREAALVAVGMAVFEHPLEYDLGDVFGRHAVARELCEVAVERPVVALEELAHAVEVAVAHGEHELMVKGRGAGFHGWALAPVNPGRLRMHRDFCGGCHGWGAAWLEWGVMPCTTAAGASCYRLAGTPPPNTGIDWRLRIA